MSNTIPVSQRINVQVILSPVAAQGQSLDTMLLVSNTDSIDPVERYRFFSTLEEVGLSLGTSSDAYTAARAYFSQVPKPRGLYVGLWARTAKKGGLRCGTLSKSQQSMSDWNAITGGGFTITVDGGTPVSVTGMNFSAATDMAGVATIIQAALTSASVAATVQWNTAMSRMEFYSDSTGALSTVANLTAPATGTPIQDDLRARITDTDAYSYAGVPFQSPSTTAAIFEDLIGQRFYAVGTIGTSVTDTNHIQWAQAVQGAQNKHVYVVTSSDPACLSSVSTSDLAATLKALNLSRTFLTYSSQTWAAGISAYARLLTVDYGAENTALTLMYKNLPGIAAENLTTSQANVLRNKNCNVFTAYDNDTNILQFGTMTDGNYADVVAGTDWLAVQLQTELWNVLYTSRTKIPQTDAGVHRLVTTAEAVCGRAVRNGLLAPGIWNSDGFGAMSPGDFLSKGYYVYAQRVDSQPQADRAARKAPSIQVAAKLAGAVHEVALSAYVNQ